MRRDIAAGEASRKYAHLALDKRCWDAELGCRTTPARLSLSLCRSLAADCAASLLLAARSATHLPGPRWTSFPAAMKIGPAAPQSLRRRPRQAMSRPWNAVTPATATMARQSLRLRTPRRKRSPGVRLLLTFSPHAASCIHLPLRLLAACSRKGSRLVTAVWACRARTRHVRKPTSAAPRAARIARAGQVGADHGATDDAAVEDGSDQKTRCVRHGSRL